MNSMGAKSRVVTDGESGSTADSRCGLKNLQTTNVMVRIASAPRFETATSGQAELRCPAAIPGRHEDLSALAYDSGRVTHIAA